MIVYIDYIFIENLIMNYLLLFQTSNFLKEKNKLIKKILASIIGSIYVCIMLVLKLNYLNYVVAKLSLSFVMVYICFLPKSLKKYIKEIITFYFITIINLGTYLIIITLFNVNINNSIIKIVIYIIGSVVIYIINNEIWRIFKLKLKKENLLYDVYIQNNGKYIQYKGFIDTGNTCRHINTGRMIFFANKKNNIDVSSYKEVEIELSTIAGKGVQKGYIVNNVIIKKENNIKFADVVICFTENNIKNQLGYDMIMNYEVYEEILGGIYV